MGRDMMDAPRIMMTGPLWRKIPLSTARLPERGRQPLWLKIPLSTAVLPERGRQPLHRDWLV